MNGKNKGSKCINLCSKQKLDFLKFMTFSCCWFFGQFYAWAIDISKPFSFYYLDQSLISLGCLNTSLISSYTIKFLIYYVIVFCNPVSVWNKNITYWCCMSVKRPTAAHLIKTSLKVRGFLKCFISFHFLKKWKHF